MGRYVARRIIQSFFVIAFVVVLVFVLARLTGDPTDLYLHEFATEESRQSYREAHGLDKPVSIQLMNYLGDLARFDCGVSLWQHRPALTVVLERLPLTLKLATATIIVAMTVAFILGSISALRPLSTVDRATTFISLIGVTVPDFWLALILIMVFAVRLDWFPTSGTGGLEYLVLPLITLAWRPLGRMAQVVRTSVMEQLSAPYVTTARAKGLAQWLVIFRHVARNAFIPVLTVAGAEFVGLANGAVIVETVFGWPGIGKLTIDAMERRDFAIIQAAVLVVAVIVVVLNLVIDFCYAAIDPRIRYD